MKGSGAKRGTHGLRKRCPRCKRLRKFARVEERRGFRLEPQIPEKQIWHKRDGMWVCGYCIAKEARPAPTG